MKSTTKYFDMQHMFDCFEANNQAVLSADTKNMLLAIEPIINKAYSDGYKAGREAVLDE